MRLWKHGFQCCLVSTAMLILIGCSITRTTGVFDESQVNLPLPRVADNSFVLDIFFARIPCDPQLDDQLWAAIDEQAIASDLRRALINDGFRCGIIEAQIPKQLEQVLELDQQQHGLPPTKLDRSVASLGIPEATMMGAPAEQNRRIYLRTGRHAEVVTSTVRDKITILRRAGEVVSGTTYDDAQTAFRLIAVDAGNGQTRVTLAPEIQHGAPKTRFTGRDGSLSLEASRERQPLDELTVQASLIAGQTLILTSTSEPLTVGANFFQCVDDARRQRKLLLIRLVSAGQDRLYRDSAENLTIEDL